MKAPPAVIKLARMVFGEFNQKAWDDLRRGPFAQRSKINELRRRHGLEEMTAEEYAAAYEDYYRRHPDAHRSVQMTERVKDLEHLIFVKAFDKHQDTIEAKLALDLRDCRTQLDALREAVLKFVSAHKHGQDLDEKSVLYKKMKARAEGGGDSAVMVPTANAEQTGRPALNARELMKRPKQERDEAMKRGAEIMKDEYEGGGESRDGAVLPDSAGGVDGDNAVRNDQTAHSVCNCGGPLCVDNPITEGGEEQAAKAADSCSPNAKPSTRSSDTSTGSTSEHALEPHYRGDNSEVFWDAINSHPDQDELYTMGCELQTLEHKILDKLIEGGGEKEAQPVARESISSVGEKVGTDRPVLDCEACNGSGNLCDPTQPPGKMWSTCPVCKGTRKMEPKE